MKRILKSKDFFRHIRAEQVELFVMEQKFSSKYMECMPSGIRYDLDKVQTSPRDMLPEKFAELDALEQKVKEIHARLMERKRKALEIVETLDNPNQRAVMKLYYLTLKPTGKGAGRFYSWQDVADVTGYGLRNITSLHGAALMQLEKLFS